MLDSAPAVPGETVSRVSLSDTAIDLLRKLWTQYGPLMFHQSGGCCDGSRPICLDDGELLVGDGDVLLGQVGHCPFYIDRRQFAVWKKTQLILDVDDGEPEGFSLAADGDRHFITRSRVFSPDEIEWLAGQPPG